MCKKYLKKFFNKSDCTFEGTFHFIDTKFKKKSYKKTILLLFE